jgi:hypothetical protein
MQISFEIIEQETRSVWNINNKSTPLEHNTQPNTQYSCQIWV